jgi:predicted MFS family arabinose efflux permease
VQPAIHEPRRTAIGAAPASSSPSLPALQWLNFFVADVQTGVGPFLAAYLTSRGWNPRDTGLALTLGGLVTVASGPFAGSFIDNSRNKRAIIVAALALLAAGATLILAGTHWSQVAPAQAMIGIAGALLPPTLAAITMGIVGPGGFDRQFGRNQSFNSAGNVAAALLLAAISLLFDGKGIFLATALLALPALATLRRINPREIDDTRARGGLDNKKASSGVQDPARAEPWWRALLLDKTLLLFLLCSFFFHLANAAMLPQLGEMLARGSARLSAPFMSACIIVTQLVIAVTASRVGQTAWQHGRKPLLLLGFGILPIRGVLYTLTHSIALLIAIQILDGVANAIFVVVSILVVSDLMQNTGHFNLAQGALGTAVGLGAALSTALGGFLALRYGFAASFLGLASVAAIAFILLWAAIPETRVAPQHTTGETVA